MCSQSQPTNKRIVLVIAHRNFRDEEYLEPKKIFIEAGMHIATACSVLLEAVGSFGAKIIPDILLNEIDASAYDAVVFVGGAGSKEYWDNPVAHRIARETASAGRLLCAICSAGVVLANAGVLKGRKATIFPADIDALRRCGAIYTGEHVEIDGIFITADGP